MEEGTQRGVDHVGMVMKKDTVIFPCVLKNLAMQKIHVLK